MTIRELRQLLFTFPDQDKEVLVAVLHKDRMMVLTEVEAVRDNGGNAQIDVSE